MINLGSEVKDTISGFNGVAYQRVDYLYGCSHITIEPIELKDGKPGEMASFDEQRVVETKAGPPFSFPAVKFKLGSKVKDPVTGFEGIATGRVVDMYGHARIGIAPTRLHEGKVIDTHYFDESRVQLVEERKPTVSPQAVATSGGPSTAPSARVMR